jgi:hypothetical protein
MVEVRLDTAEREAHVETQAGQKGLKRRDARETGPASARLQVLGPEELRPARFLRRAEGLGVAHDLRGRFEGDALVESNEESLEVPDSGFRVRELERLEDVVQRFVICDL